MKDGRQATLVRRLVGARPSGRQSLTAILHDVQERFGYLPMESIDELSRLMGISESEIYGVATFYKRFRFTPPADHTVQVCLGTACHVRGGPRVLRAFEKEIGASDAPPARCRRFDIERVHCIGCCALGPVAVLDGKVSARLGPEKIRSLLRRCEREDAGAVR